MKQRAGSFCAQKRKRGSAEKEVSNEAIEASLSLAEGTETSVHI